MDKKKRKGIDNDSVAPGIDPDDAFGEDASATDIEKGESTKVTRLTYDEYDPSREEK
ncbi:hypothetical protein [Lentibacillus cibarius]|uniref:hypothetical protein n=1 Tax=Lentibacillus cibarius TaxID=2583219 RepID=UPI00163D572E|nr:hypothetical protein [Lentibacillus cibarius]